MGWASAQPLVAVLILLISCNPSQLELGHAEHIFITELRLVCMCYFVGKWAGLCNRATSKGCTNYGSTDGCSPNRRGSKCLRNSSQRE